MTIMTFRLLALGLLALLVTAPSEAAYPERPVTIIVPFPPGGASDNTARVMSIKLNEYLGQPVVIDNRGGANGGIGAGLLARAKPDGYTIMIGSIGVYAINPVLYKELQYHPQRDFDLLTVAVRTPNVLVTRPNFPANTVAELVDYLKKNPDKVSFASSGIGSSDHLTAALLWQKTGTTGVHVPYRGGGPAVQDLMGGHADVSFQNLGTVANHIRADKMKLLAVTGEKREAGFNAPTMAEGGVPGLVVYSWQAVAAPKGLPADVKAKLDSALSATLKDADVSKRLVDIGFEVVGNTSAQFGEFLASELARWKEVIDTGKITAEP
jgi:tripartite-type tricarboxylate transporter receptor subunit TctC